MKKINFSNAEVFSKLEDDAIDGRLNYSDFPPEEYKYFSKLAKLGYNNRHKGWDIDICLAKQKEFKDDYIKEKEHANCFMVMFKQYNQNRIKACELEPKIYKAQSVYEITDNALKLIELLLDEEGFYHRIQKKINDLGGSKDD